jgi:hypothetical protein
MFEGVAIGNNKDWQVKKYEDSLPARLAKVSPTPTERIPKQIIF